MRPRHGTPSGSHRADASGARPQPGAGRQARRDSEEHLERDRVGAQRRAAARDEGQDRACARRATERDLGAATSSAPPPRRRGPALGAGGESPRQAPRGGWHPAGAAQLRAPARGGARPCRSRLARPGLRLGALGCAVAARRGAHARPSPRADRDRERAPRRARVLSPGSCSRPGGERAASAKLHKPATPSRTHDPRPERPPRPYGRAALRSVRVGASPVPCPRRLAFEGEKQGPWREP